MTSFDVTSQITPETEGGVSSPTVAPDPLRMLIPGFLQPRGPGGVAGRDRTLLNAVGSVFDSLIEYTPIGDLRDAYEVSTLVATPRSALPRGTVGGTLGMLGAFIGGGKIAGAHFNARVAADLEADPSVSVTRRRSRKITDTGRVSLSWEQQQITRTPKGYRGQLISGAPILPHRALDVMRDVDPEIATMILQYGGPSVDGDMALYDQYLTSQLGGRSIFDQQPESDEIGGTFAPTAPDEIFVGSERVARASLQARFLQQMHPEAWYATSVEELAELISATGYQRLTGRTVPVLDTEAQARRSALLTAWINTDSESAQADEFMKTQARSKALIADETQIEAAAKWAGQKFRISKIATAWNARMIYGDFGPAFDGLWERFVNGNIELGSIEADAWGAAMTELGAMVDRMPTTDPGLGWTPNGRILGFELNAAEPSAVVFGEYGEPLFQRGGGTITGGTEVLPPRAQPPGTVMGNARKSNKIGEARVEVIGSALIPKTVMSTYAHTLRDPLRPELGSKAEIGAKETMPSQLTMTGAASAALEAELFGHAYGMFKEAANATGGFTSFHRRYGDVQQAAQNPASEVDAVIPSRIVDFETDRVLPSLVAVPTTYQKMDIDTAVRATKNRFKMGKAERITATIDPATGQLHVAPQDALFVQALGNDAALRRHGLIRPKVVQVQFANLDHANYETVAPLLADGQVHEIQGYPGRDLVARESYRAVYPTLVTWAAHRTNHTYAQLARVFGMYGMQTDLNATNIPAFIMDALGWTSRVTTPEKTTMRRPRAAEELTKILESLEAQPFTESQDATRYLMSSLENWYHRHHDAAARYLANNEPGGEEFRAWYGEEPKDFAGLNATTLDAAKGVFDMDATRLNEAVDLTRAFLSSMEFADSLAALHQVATSAGVTKTKRWGVGMEMEGVTEPGLYTEILRRAPLSKETKTQLEEELKERPDLFFEKKFLTYSISYDPKTKRWGMQTQLNKAKLTAYFQSISPARVDEIMRAPDEFRIPFDPSQIMTDINRYDGKTVNLQDLIDVALAMQTEQGQNLYRAIVADVHMAMIALGFSPGGLPLATTYTKDPTTGERVKVPNVIGGAEVLSPAPAHEAQFGDTLAYRALSMAILNLRMTQPGFEDAASLQSFLWYPWRILGGSSGSGYVVSPRVLHAMQGRISNQQNIDALRRVTPDRAQVRDFELAADQMNGLSAILRMTNDEEVATRYVPTELIDKNDAWWVLQDAEVRVTVKKSTGKKPGGEVAEVRIFHPAVQRTGRIVSNTKADVDRTVRTAVQRTAFEATRRGSRWANRPENQRLMAESYALYDRIRQGAWEEPIAQSWREQTFFEDGSDGAWLRDWSHGWYNENAFRALFMDENTPPDIRRELRDRFLHDPDGENRLKRARPAAVARARDRVYDMTQRHLEIMGVPDEVIVWRQVLNRNDLENGMDRDENLPGHLEGDAYRYAPASFSLVRPTTGYFTSAIPFKVKRADILLSTLSVAQGVPVLGWQSYWPAENEVMINWADVTELDPIDVLTSQAGASSFGVTYDSTFHTDLNAQPGEGLRRIQMIVPRPSSKASEKRMRRLVDKIANTVSPRIKPPHIEYAETQRPEWLLPTSAQGVADLLATFEGTDQVTYRSAQMILQAMTAARLGDTEAFHTRIGRLNQYLRKGQLAELTADDIDATLEAVEARGGASPVMIAEAERVAQRRATWEVVSETLSRMEQAGTADWTTNPEAAELAALLGQMGTIPTRVRENPAMVINFMMDDPADLQSLAEFLHSPLADAFPEYGDLAVSDARREVEKLQGRGITGRELARARTRLTESQTVGHQVRNLPPATAWLPKTETDGVHVKGYRVMDVFGEVDPHMAIYSMDPNDKVIYLVNYLAGAGVHPDYLPEVVVEAMSQDGQRAGSVYMELADTDDPGVRKVALSKSHTRLLRGSANLHVTGSLQVRSEGNTQMWGEGEAIVEGDVAEFAVETAEDTPPEGYELGRGQIMIDSEDRSLFGVRNMRLDNNGENPILVRPQTMAIGIPPTVRGIKSVKQDRQVGNPKLEEPTFLDRTLVVFDSDAYEDYFTGRGYTDLSRVVEVKLEWKDNRITGATIFVNDVTSAAYAKQLLRRTGVSRELIDFEMMDVNQPVPPELTADTYLSEGELAVA